MNKKGIYLDFVFVMLLTVCILMVAFIIYDNKLGDDACGELGFKKEVYRNSISFCEDVEGNLY